MHTESGFLLITEKDIGRKVRLHNGDETAIDRYTPDVTFSVLCSNGDIYTNTGRFFNHNEDTDELDIVGFVDDAQKKQPAELILEAGKFYRTREGRKAEVLYIIPEKYNEAQRVLVGLDSSIEKYELNGNYWGSGKEDPNNLVSEWKDPVRVQKTIYFNVYPGGHYYMSTAPDSAAFQLGPGGKTIPIEIDVEFD